MIASTVANMVSLIAHMFGGKKGSKPRAWEPEDFIPGLGRPVKARRKQTGAEMEAVFRAATAAHAAQLKGEGRRK